ncbi:MAG: SLBB domain-containing protein [Gammaproteobacteria bacterium]|nr:SLBB domain-containing protein [Gammaproteobacteria bacterium]
MSAKVFRVARGIAAVTTLFLGFHAFAQTPSPAQIQAFKSLPQDQQQALMQQYLGGAGGSGGLPGVTTATGAAPNQPNATLPNALGLQVPGLLKPDQTRDGHYLRTKDENPELRADDTVLIELTPAAPSGCTGGPGIGANNPNNANNANSANGANGSPNADGMYGSNGNCYSSSGMPGGGGANANDLGGGQFTEPEQSPEYQRQLGAFRRRILAGNPYKLNRYGALEVPGLPAIPLAGLTQREASLRLSQDPNLKDFRVTVTLLRLQPTGTAALKPFGYDLFEQSPSTFAPVTDVPVPPNYIVGPGDTLDVQLYGNEPANYLLSVQRDGRVNFPKLGPIMVSGMSFDAAKGLIERRVAQALIGTRVSVTMGNLRTIRIFVLGEAKAPGSYTVGGLSTMTNALFASGGVNKTGSLRNIELKRDGQLVTVLDLYDLLLHGDTSGDRQLEPGDVIFIPPIGRTASIDGAVRRPAIYELKSENTIGQLIGLAGGLLPDADQTLVHVRRIAPSRAFETLDVNLMQGAGRSTPLADGDQVSVPAIRPTLEDSVQLTGHVYRPGAFEYRPGLRLSDVIPSFDELRPEADPHYVMIRRIVPPDDHVEVVSADLERALAARGSAADPRLMPRDEIYVFDLSASRAQLIQPIIKTLELQASPQHPAAIVSIDGQVKAPGRYALEPGMRVSDLIRAGGSLDDAAFGGEAELTRYQVVRGEARRSTLIPVDLDAIRRGDAGADIELQPYDLLIIKTVPEWRLPGSVVLAGAVRFPGRYPIHQGETLHSVLVRAGGFTLDAFPEGAVFTRDELKVKEKAQLDLLANRFQNDLTALSLRSAVGGTTGTSVGAVAAASASQSLVVGQQLLKELRTAQPVGRLVVNLDRVWHGRAGGPADVMVRNGDYVFVPKKTQEVTILGEVQNPTSQIYHPGWSRADYIEKSGGVTQNADKKRIYIVRANGDVVGGQRTGWFRRSQDVEMRPGDTIVVPLDAERVPALPLWTAATTILYNIAIAVLALKNL